MIFRIRLADICIQINSIYDDVYSKCLDYLDEVSKPEFTIEPRLFEVEEEAEKDKNTGYDLPRIETLLVYRKIAELLIDRNILLVHGSVVAVGDTGIMFAAPSGIGKTTHSQLWTSHIKDSYIVNGDKPLLSIEDSLYAYGTPWAGKENFQRNCKVSLKAITFIKRGTHNTIRKISKDEALKGLMNQVYMPYKGELLAKTMKLIGKMLDMAVFYEMECDNFKDDALETALTELGPVLGIEPGCHKDGKTFSDE